MILSPHLDDAILSTFSILDGPGEVLVVNVCDGVPSGGTASDWTRLCGGTDDAIQQRLRAAEDRAALATIGRTAVSLGLLDADQCPAATSAAIAERVSAEVPVAARLIAPVGIGSHPDHLATRDAALEVTAAGRTVPLELHADLPYAFRCGWPPWVSRAEPDPHIDPDVPWERALRRVPARREALLAVVTSLDPAQRARKARALACYASQLPALAGGPHRSFGDEALSFEVRWKLTPTG